MIIKQNRSPFVHSGSLWISVGAQAYTQTQAPLTDGRSGRRFKTLCARRTTTTMTARTTTKTIAAKNWEWGSASGRARSREEDRGEAIKRSVGEVERYGRGNTRAGFSILLPLSSFFNQDSTPTALKHKPDLPAKSVCRARILTRKLLNHQTRPLFHLTIDNIFH